MTQVGTIPDDWECSTVNDIASPSRNAIVGGPFGSDLVSKDYVRQGVPVIRGQNMSGQWVSGDFVFVTQEKANRLEANLASPGDLIFTQRGTLGQVSLVPAEPFGCYLISQSQMKLTINSAVADPLFFFYVFTSDKHQELIRSGTIQTGVPHINLGILRKIPVQLPSLHEQRAIAHALSDVDNLIGGLQKLIAKKRALKQATMQQMLTARTRLPGFKKQWKTQRLRDLLTYERPDQYIVSNTAYNVHGEIPVLTANKSFVLGYTDEKFGVCRDLPAIIFDDFTTDTKFAAFPFKVKSSAIKLLRAKHNRASLRYMFERLQLIHFPRCEHRRYYISEFQNLAVLVPDHDEQEAIVSILSDMDTEISLLEHEEEKTQRVKQGMMQQLLTGRGRLIEWNAREILPKKASMESKTHSWAFNEAVVISMLSKQFGTEQFPLGRKRYTKLSYLLHRHIERQTVGYLKKAAGPYNPKTKYGGPERIAIESGYIREHKNGAYRGFVVAENIAQAEGYFEKWYGANCVTWLEQFRFIKNDELEVLATVDMAVEDLRSAGKSVDVENVKALIHGDAEWRAKLSRQAFSDIGIKKAIEAARKLFA